MNSSPACADTPHDGPFATTHWTRVIASQGNSADAQVALRELCAAYYEPVMAALRSRGRDEDQARELTHAFFEQLLQPGSLDGADPSRGRFRSYLLGALKHHLANRSVREARLKRSAGADHLPIDTIDIDVEGDSVCPSVPFPDPAVFDRAWALHLIGRVLDILRKEAVAAGNERLFDILKPGLIGGEAVSHGPRAELVAELGLSDGALRVSLHRLRRRFRDLVKAEIRRTVSDPSEIPAELDYLIAALTTRSS